MIECGVTSQFVEYQLTTLQDFRTDAVVHDNACGNGSISKAVVAKIEAAQAAGELLLPKADISIHATDMNLLFVDGISSTDEAEGSDQLLDFKAEIADCQNMPRLATSHFRHPITGFMLQQFQTSTPWRNRSCERRSSVLQRSDGMDGGRAAFHNC